MRDYIVIKVTVDRNLCIACGVAPSICSEIFVIGEDNQKNRLLDIYSEETTEEVSKGAVPDNLYDFVKVAAEACPVQAIIVNIID